MCFRKFVVLCTLVVCLAGAALGQSLADTTVIPLTVDKGVPLNVLLTEKLRFKENEVVNAKLAEPIYAFDREVIPAGTKVEGRITGFKKAGAWKRVSAMLGGDFTPVREPQITFDTLVLSRGVRIPIQTVVSPGADKVVGLGDKHQAGGELKNSLMSTVKPGKEQMQNWLWGMSPYHPQSLPQGLNLTAVLLEPLDFGEAIFKEGDLDAVGTEPPLDSIVSVRLVTALNSRTAQPGAAVEALTTRPIFSEDHRLILPVGSVLRGELTDANPARSRHRHGELAFNFTTLALPDSLTPAKQPQDVDSSLVSVRVGHDMKDMRIDATGAARIKESKKRFIAPALAFVTAERRIGASSDGFGAALAGAYRGKFLKQVTGGGPGFGLPASIAGAMVPPVGIGLGFYSAARSVYTNFLGRGRDINLPANTVMDLRLEKVGPVQQPEGESSPDETTR